MLDHIADDSFDKENTAPANLFNQTRGKVDNTLDIKVPSRRKGYRDFNKFSGTGMTEVCAGFLSPPEDQSKSRPLMPLSINSTSDESNFCPYGEAALLGTRHAWVAMTPTFDRKSAKLKRGTSLPALYGSNVTVDSPDPNSKYYSKSPPIHKHTDSPDSDASYLAANDARAILGPNIVGEIEKLSD